MGSSIFCDFLRLYVLEALEITTVCFSHELLTLLNTELR